MANKTLFKSVKTPAQVKVNPKNWALTVNEAGGAAFSFPDKLALAQFAVTGTFNGVFYATAEDQLDNVKKLVDKVDSKFIAKLAVYSHKSAFMKDMPAYLLAVLHSRQENVLLAQVFDKVITTFKMLANFVQIVRSGVTGRKSFGTATKYLIKQWLAGKTPLQTFNGSIGLSNPSVSDIIKMVHPSGDASLGAMYAYIAETRGYEEKMGLLPDEIKVFEQMKKGVTVEKVPNIPFRALTNVQLSAAQWMQIARDMPFNTLRQNLNMLGKRGVYENREWLNEIAAKLAKADGNVFPYQLFTTYQNTTDLPSQISNALQDAAEIATANVPSFGDDVVVFVDVSGSMGQSITGYRPGVPQSKTRCVDVAGLVASCVLRQNKNAEVVMFDTGVHTTKLNARDSIMTNAATIARFGGGGTNTAIAMAYANQQGWKAKTVIYVSDNESWAGRAYGTAEQWLVYKRRVPSAKLINIDLVPNTHSQVPDNKDVMNIGGFSDAIWPAIVGFISGSGADFVSTIEESVAL